MLGQIDHISRQLITNEIKDKRLASLVGAIAGDIHEVIDKVCGSVDTCRNRSVITALVLKDVLQKYGYEDAREMPCQVMVANDAYAHSLKHIKKLKADNTPEAELDKIRSAWSRQGAYLAQCGGGDGTVGGDNWSGHLVTIVDRYLIDLTVGGLSRPDKGIDLAAVAFSMFPDAQLKHGWVLGRLSSEDGVVAEWSCRPHNIGYRASSLMSVTGLRGKAVTVLLKKIQNKVAF